MNKTLVVLLLLAVCFGSSDVLAKGKKRIPLMPIKSQKAKS